MWHDKPNVVTVMWDRTNMLVVPQITGRTKHENAGYDQKRRCSYCDPLASSIDFEKAGFPRKQLVSLLLVIRPTCVHKI